MIRLVEESKTDQPIGIRKINFNFKLKRQKVAGPLLNNGMDIEDLTLSEKNIYTEKLPNGETIDWVLPHSRAFPEFFNKRFAEYSTSTEMFVKNIAESTDQSPPFPYQQLIKEYLRYGTPYRAALLEHGLGSGKTRTTIMVAETFRNEGLPIMVLTPAFLRLNFMDEIHKWGGEDIKIDLTSSPSQILQRQRIIDQAYRFIHYNATGHSINAKDRKTGENIAGKGGVFEQLAKIGVGFPEEDLKYGNLFPYLNKKYGPLKPPKGMLIVIEEIHNLNRTFANGAQHSSVKWLLYPLLLMARDCKIIGLSGTPIISSPFEMATLYSLLRGEIKQKKSPLPAYAFPQSETEFRDIFVDYEGLKLINTETLMSHIIGLGSLFKGVTEDVDRIIFPAGKETPIKAELEMSEYQTAVHDAVLLAEEGKKKKSVLTKGNSNQELKELMDGFVAPPDLNIPSNYHINSRQASNFAFPQEVSRPRPMEKATFENTPLLKDYTMKFNTEDMDAVFKRLKDANVNVEIIRDEYRLAKSNEEKAVILSTLIKKAYPALISQDNPLISLLHKDDIAIMQPYTGTYKERMLYSMKLLTEKPDKYFSLKNLEKYSIKMATIYKNITGDLLHGGAHTVKTDGGEDGGLAGLGELGESAELAELAEFETAMIEESVVENEDDEDALIDQIKVKQIRDVDDPMLNHMDVFKTDAELKKLKLRVKGGPALVYSFFNSIEGAGLFSKILECHGFEAFSESTWNGVSDIDKIERRPRYAFIKGGMNLKLKANLMRVFNNRANRHGQLIRVIFATQAAAEGISLYHLRQIHIMEPHWDNVLIEQVIGRGFRLRSHRYLSDKTEREIQVYQYYAKRNMKIALNLKDSMHSIDYIIQGVADRKSALVGQLKSLRGRSAIDCKINSAYNNLGLTCFDFRGNKSGNAFSATITDDVRDEKVTVKKTVETSAIYKIKYITTKSGKQEQYYIKSDIKPVEIGIFPDGDGSRDLKLIKKKHLAEIAWSNSGTGDKVNIADFKQEGYIVNNMFLPNNTRIHVFK